MYNMFKSEMLSNTYFYSFHLKYVTYLFLHIHAFLLTILLIVVLIILKVIARLQPLISLPNVINVPKYHHYSYYYLLLHSDKQVNRAGDKHSYLQPHVGVPCDHIFGEARVPIEV